MLYLPPGVSVPVRVHGAFVGDDEVHRVVDDWKKRFNRIQEKGFSIKRNVLKYNLPDMQLKISTTLINTLESELCLAMDTIRFEDEQ